MAESKQPLQCLLWEFECWRNDFDWNHLQRYLMIYFFVVSQHFSSLSNNGCFAINIFFLSQLNKTLVYVYIDIHVHVHIYIHIHVHIHMHIQYVLYTCICIYIYMSWTMDLIYVMYQRTSRIAKCQAARPVWLQCAMDDFTAVPWRCGRRALKVLNLGIFQQNMWEIKG